MTNATKNRLQARFKQLLDDTKQSPRTLFDIEAMTLQLREQLTAITLEEISNEAKENQQRETPENAPALSPAEQTNAAPTNLETNIGSASKICCPLCHRAAWYKGERSRHLTTRAGILCLIRRYYYCKRCKKGTCPVDARLHLPADSQFTAPVRQKVAYLCALLPFDAAMKTLHYLANIAVSARSAQRLCKEAQHSAARFAEAFTKERDKQCLPLAFAAALPASLPRPEVLYIQADGVQTPMRGGSYKEMKIGVVRSEHKDGREDRPSRYVNHLGEAKDFAPRLESLAIACGSLCAKSLVFLGDGAAWLWNIAQSRFPKAVQILDFWHALEYVAAVARDAFKDAAKDAAKDAWLCARATEMKASAWGLFGAALAIVRPCAAESVDAVVRYFGNHACRMDYAKYLKAGLCIGSGLAESSCKRIVTQRLKGSGMRWSEPGAQSMGLLRCLLLGGEWEALVSFWNRQLDGAISSPLS